MAPVDTRTTPAPPAVGPEAARPPPLYLRVMGEPAFNRLPPAVQAFHRLAGVHALRGEVQTQAPARRLGRWLARLMGTATQSVQGPLGFRLEAEPQAETWTRYFPGQTLVSRLSAWAGQPAGLQEQMGPARLRFHLRAGPDHMAMELVAMRFLGIPCPRWLMPRIVAREFDDEGRLRFEVRAEVPGLGLVVAYQGWLALPADAVGASGP